VDFVHDVAESGRKFRVLSVIDVHTGNVWRWKWTRVCEPESDPGGWSGFQESDDLVRGARGSQVTA